MHVRKQRSNQMLYVANYLSETKAEIFLEIQKLKTIHHQHVHNTEKEKVLLRKCIELYANDLCIFCVYVCFDE